MYTETRTRANTCISVWLPACLPACLCLSVGLSACSLYADHADVALCIYMLIRKAGPERWLDQGTFTPSQLKGQGCFRSTLSKVLALLTPSALREANKRMDTGMLISVPVLALMKSAALSSLVSEDGVSRPAALVHCGWAILKNIRAFRLDETHILRHFDTTNPTHNKHQQQIQHANKLRAFQQNQKTPKDISKQG